MTPIEDIRRRLPELSPALATIGKYVLDRPNEIVTSSMRAIGVRAGSPPATLVRFAQHLGYTGWPELKAALTSELGLGPDSYGRRARHLVDRKEDRTLTTEMFEVQRRNLAITQGDVEARLARACALLEKANDVHAIGYRACFPIAFSFVYVYRIFRSSVHLVDGHGGSFEMQQRAVAAGDAVVAISFAPYSREPLQFATNAKAAGARVLAVTDSIASPISLIADETLLFSIVSPSFFPSIAAGTALMEVLVELLASRAGRGVVRRIARTEEHLFESGAYLPTVGAR